MKRLGRRHPAVLVIDLGGNHIKVMSLGEMVARKAKSGPLLTPRELIVAVEKLSKGLRFDRIALGFPGPVSAAGPITEPGNLGEGWVGFDFVSAFGKPVKVLNDAALQALGAYEGGRMLFLGLGTGFGAAFIAPKIILPMELSELEFRGRGKLGSLLGDYGLKRLGRSKWNDIAMASALEFMKVFNADYVVFGGGNASKLKALPPGVRRGHNLAALRGGIRAWQMDDIPVQCADEPNLLLPGWEIA